MAEDQGRRGPDRRTSRGPGRDHLRLLQGGRGEPAPVPDDPADRFIDGDARTLLSDVDPVSAEIWASRLIAMFDQFREQARLEHEEAPDFELAIIERCAERGDTASLVAASALAAVLPPPLDARARGVADDIAGVDRERRPPGWVLQIGTARPTCAWLATDHFGVQDAVMVAFEVGGDPQHHLLLTLVDHDLSGQATDAWVAADVEPVIAKWLEGDDTLVVELDVQDALQRLHRAVAISDDRAGDAALRTEGFAHHRPLIWARLRAAGLAPG